MPTHPAKAVVAQTAARAPFRAMGRQGIEIYIQTIE